MIRRAPAPTPAPPQYHRLHHACGHVGGHFTWLDHARQCAALADDPCPSCQQAAASSDPDRRTYGFVVPGAPVPKGRPRLAAAGHVYTPAATTAHELAVWAAAAAAHVQPFVGDVAMTVTFYLPGNTAADVDNLVKTVADGLTGKAYDNDRQLADVHARRVYAAALPRTEIQLEGVPCNPQTPPRRMTPLPRRTLRTHCIRRRP